MNVSNNFVSDNAVDKAINMFKNHPSIIKINQAGCVRDKFSFLHVSDDNVFRAINSIVSSKAYQKDNIPPKILKGNNDISALVLRYDINKCIDIGKFPSNLKNSDVTPTYKREDRLRFQKFMKRFYISKFIVILIIYSQNPYVVIGQDTVHSTA